MPPRRSYGRRSRSLPDYPDIKVEVIVDYGLTDIVAERYDAGVCLGEQVAKEMIVVRMARTSASRPAPRLFRDAATAEAAQDLTAHICINLRLPTYGRSAIGNSTSAGAS